MWIAVLARIVPEPKTVWLNWRRLRLIHIFGARTLGGPRASRFHRWDQLGSSCTRLSLPLAIGNHVKVPLQTLIVWNEQHSIGAGIFIGILERRNVCICRVSGIGLPL